MICKNSEAAVDEALSYALSIPRYRVHIQLYRQGDWHEGKLMTAFVTFTTPADAEAALQLNGRWLPPLTLRQALQVAPAAPRLVNYNF
jgi:hypothetical protein